MPKWNPDVYECPTCKDLVYSRYPGHWAACKCFENKADSNGGYVDQTEHYIRIGGSLKHTGRKLNAS